MIHTNNMYVPLLNKPVIVKIMDLEKRTYPGSRDQLCLPDTHKNSF